MTIRSFALVGSLLLALPSTALACLCAGPAEALRPFDRAARERDAAFAGQALEVGESQDPRFRQIVRFVIESSWRGPMRDTVTLGVTHDAPCMWFTEGARYFVIADSVRRAGSGPQLTSALCDQNWPLRSNAVRVLIADLGPPGWVAPARGARSLDRIAVPLGTPVSRQRTEGSVALVVPGHPMISRFELGDYGGRGSSVFGAILYLRPGLYQFRIIWTDSTSYESYLSVRCKDGARESCQVFPYFPGMK